ncbi:MAG: DUF1835 domain-containing protein [Gemmatimonadota bacterium]
MLVRPLLHVLNGDSVRPALAASGVAGEVAVFADVLHEGPVPTDTDMRAWLETRARFHARQASYDDALDTLLRWQAAFDAHDRYARIVLWFEHDLFDQLLLIRHLAFFDRVGRTDGLELVCTDRYLGPLASEELAALYERRTSVGARARELGRRAWDAFTSADRNALPRLLESDLSALPYLEAALRRLLEEYPSEQDGLGRTDRQILSLLAERERGFHELFAANARLEEAIFMGDLVLHDHLARLASVRVPLVLTGEVIRITQAGRDVASGKRNALALNGSDRWIGGVDLSAAPADRSST